MVQRSLRVSRPPSWHCSVARPQVVLPIWPGPEQHTHWVVHPRPILSQPQSHFPLHDRNRKRALASPLTNCPPAICRAQEDLEKEACFILGQLAVKPEYQARIAQRGALQGLVRLLKEHRSLAASSTSSAGTFPLLGGSGKSQQGSGGAARRAADAITNLAHENVEIKNMVGWGYQWCSRSGKVAGEWEPRDDACEPGKRAWPHLSQPVWSAPVDL